MTMPLAEALEVVGAMESDFRGQSTVGTTGDGHYRRVADALASVLAAARQTFASETVSRVNALSAQALEMARREQTTIDGETHHAFVPPRNPEHSTCDRCFRLPSDPLHSGSSR